MTTPGKIFGGVLIVAGTTIGAGMLAMPVPTGLMGFFPTIVLFFCYWLYTLMAAFCFLEVNMWISDHNVNLLSMAKATLGRWGQAVGWVFYLFLLYALTTAYTAGCAPIFNHFLQSIIHESIPDWAGLLPLVCFFGFFVYEGAQWVDLINRILMVGLIICFVMITGWLLPQIDSSLLKHANWSYMTAAVSMVATSFGYQIVIPTLTRYLDRDIAAMKKVIIIGSTVPLFVYIFWEFVTLGVIPLQGSGSLLEGYIDGKDAVQLILVLSEQSWMSILAEIFSFFAIVTSFLGVSLSLKDFLADGLHIKKDTLGKLILCALTFLPPLFFAWASPRAFFGALSYAGAFGVVTLLGILPALMVWWGRYRHGYSSAQFKTPGGKFTLVMIIIFSLFVIMIELGNQIGYFS